MKLLFDQNISFRIIKELKEIFPYAKQVRELGLENSSDNEIWEFAKENQYTIVTFDSDFNEIANLKGFPPKIIWLRTGNMTTKNIANLLLKHSDIIHLFIKDSNYKSIACLEIE